MWVPDRAWARFKVAGGPRIIAVAVCALLVAGSLLFEVGSSRDKVADANPQVAALVAEYDLSRQEAARRIEQQDVVGKLAGSLARHLPGVYGGAWIDHERGGAVMVAVTEPGASLATASRLGLSGSVREVQVERTMAELESISAAVWHRAKSVFPSAEARPVLELDIRHNAVAVDMPKASSPRQELRQERFAGDLRSAFGSGVAATGGHDISTYDDGCTVSNCESLRGGISIKSAKNCSIGFVARYVTGRLAVTTAGHCTPNSSGNYTHHGVIVGKRLSFQDSGDVDATAVEIEDTAFWGPKNWVFHQGFDGFPAKHDLNITSTATKDEIVIGTTLCRTGRNTNSDTQCGQVNKLNGRRSGNTGLFGLDICADGGDSGGSVYSYMTNKAYGQHVSSTEAGCTASETSYFAPIDSIQAALDVTVLTTNP